VIPPALTAEEWANSEFASHYGLATTSLEVDHKGRVFAHSEMADEDIVVILNEAVDARAVLPKFIALANAALPDGDPRKITWAMVDELREWATGFDDPRPGQETLAAIADALGSYLPPREAKP